MGLSCLVVGWFPFIRCRGILPSAFGRRRSSAGACRLVGYDNPVAAGLPSGFRSLFRWIGRW